MKAAVTKKTPGELLLDLPIPKNAGRGNGSLQITETVLQIIIKRTVLAIPGVTRFSGSSFIDSIAEIVRSKKIQDRSIQITFEDDKLTVGVAINLTFDSHPKAVADAVQTAISREIERQAGLKVAEVNVQVRDMEDAQDASDSINPIMNQEQ